MPRRRAAERRVILSDPRYNSLLVSKFINCLMQRGKKSIAEGILYRALDMVSERESSTPSVDVFKEAVENVCPMLEVKSRRVGGSTYQVPVEVKTRRSQSLAIRWLIGGASKRAGRSMEAKLAGEIMDAYHKRGAAVKKKEDTHRMAEANKAFAHYRW